MINSYIRCHETLRLAKWLLCKFQINSMFNRMIDVGEDGHMRLKCCGKFVTDIGNVPPYAIPKRRKTDYRNPLMDGEENMN